MVLPRYLQISERLTRDIAAGILDDGARLPPEVELARSLHVSVGTLRKALAELAARGLLVRRQGSGNYVRRSASPAGIYAFFHLELKNGGGMPGARTLSADKVAPPDGTGVPWELSWRFRRLRLLNGRPAALEEIWIDSARATAVDVASLPESLYRHYAVAFGLRIARVEDQVGAGPCPDWVPPGWPLASGATCGLVFRRAESREARIVEVSRTWFDPSVAAYVARWTEETA